METPAGDVFETTTLRALFVPELVTVMEEVEIAARGDRIGCREIGDADVGLRQHSRSDPGGRVIGEVKIDFTTGRSDYTRVGDRAGTGRRHDHGHHSVRAGSHRSEVEHERVAVSRDRSL